MQINQLRSFGEFGQSECCNFSSFELKFYYNIGCRRLNNTILELKAVLDIVSKEIILALFVSPS